MRSPFLFLLLLTGCPPGSSDKDDTTGIDDTGDTDTVEYDAGCITIDGGGGYANINDAITVASEGAVIELCDGTYEEAVIVDKAVTLRGASVDGTFLNGPGTELPLTITATGVTVENLVVTSARTAVDLKSGSESTLSMLTIAAAGSWGIAASDATAVITGLTVIEPASGGVQVSGGSVSIADSSFEYPGAYGIDITDDAVVSVTNTTITGTVTLTDDLSDGYAVQIDGASLTMTGSTVAGADAMGIYANQSDIVLVDTSFQDAAFLAIFAFDSMFDLSGVTVTGSLLQGIYAQGPSFTMSDSTIVGDSELSCSYLYEEWGQSGNPWCGGLLVAADTIELSEVSVSGYNNYGMLLQPDAADLTTVTVSGGTVDDVGRWGAYFYAAEGTVSGLTVSNSREPEIVDPCYGYINQSAGLLAESSDLTLDAITVSGNVGWGMSQVLGTSEVTNSTFSGNGCYTFVNYQSVATLTGNTFTNGAASGGIYDSEGVLVLDGNTFVDNHVENEYFYEYEGKDHYGAYVYTYASVGGPGSGLDLYSYGSGSVIVSNNTFTNGDQSLYVSDATSVEVTGNAWVDYESALFTASGGTDVLFANNTADDVVGPVVQAYAAEIDVEGVQVGTTRASDPTEVTYSYDYENGDANDYGSSYTSTSSSYVFYAYGSYYDDGSSIVEQPGGLTLSDVTVDQAASTVVGLYNAALDISGFAVGSAGSGFLYGSWEYYAPDVEIESLSLGAVGGGAFYVSNSSPNYGSVYLSDVNVESSAGDGIAATAIGALSLTNVSFDSVAGDGVATISRTLDYTYEYADDGTYLGTTYTDLDAATELTIDGLTIGAAGENGLSLQGGSASITGLVATELRDNGIYARGLSTLAVSNSTITTPDNAGVRTTDTYSYYSYETFEETDATADSVVTITDTEVTNAGDGALEIEGGSVTMSGVTGTSDRESGLALSNVTADVQGNMFSGNPEYGMTCDETVTLSACAANDLSGNTLGTHLGCSDACAE